MKWPSVVRYTGPLALRAWAVVGMYDLRGCGVWVVGFVCVPSRG